MTDRDTTRDAARDRLLDAMVAQAPFSGWTSLAFRAAARDADMDWPTAKRLFPGGVDDLLALWGARCDARLAEALTAHDLDAMRIRDRIALCVRLRLELMAPDREALRMALSRAALPHNVPAATAALWRTVDIMWRAAGDRATDFNYYSKRGLLAGVYGSTLLYWLDDCSEDKADTWAFLDRRIADVMQVPRLMGRLKKLAPNPERLLRAFAGR